MAATCSGDALLYVRLELNFYVLFKFHAKVRYLELKKSFTSYLRYALYQILQFVFLKQKHEILHQMFLYKKQPTLNIFGME